MAKRGIAMLRVDTFSNPRKQTRANESTPCSNGVCHILKSFHSFIIPAISFIWPSFLYKNSATQSHRDGKKSRRRSCSPLWRHQWRSFFISHDDDVKREIRVYTSRLLVNQERESEPCMHMINVYAKNAVIIMLYIQWTCNQLFEWRTLIYGISRAAWLFIVY